MNIATASSISGSHRPPEQRHEELDGVGGARTLELGVRRQERREEKGQGFVEGLGRDLRSRGHDSQEEPGKPGRADWKEPRVRERSIMWNE